MSNFQTFMVNLLVSGTAAALSKTLLAPVERIKMILQNQDSSLQIIKQQRQKYESAFDIVARVPKEQVRQSDVGGVRRVLDGAGGCRDGTASGGETA